MSVSSHLSVCLLSTIWIDCFALNCKTFKLKTFKLSGYAFSSQANLNFDLTNFNLVDVRVNPISLSYPFPFPYPFVLPLALVPRNRVVNARGENIPYEMRHHLVTVTSSYIVASWLLHHQRRQVLITNFQDASASVCVCRLRGFY